ncbi:hypothetical protein PGH46_08890 [Legionella pneumophila]|nr:hypothetical protein PGH46_08890 [Legionella pneumophila]
MNIKQNDTSTTPPILYGTAWKEDDTKRLVLQALNSGFRGLILPINVGIILKKPWVMQLINF